MRLLTIIWCIRDFQNYYFISLRILKNYIDDKNIFKTIFFNDIISKSRNIFSLEISLASINNCNPFNDVSLAVDIFFPIILLFYVSTIKIPIHQKSTSLLKIYISSISVHRLHYNNNYCAY